MFRYFGPPGTGKTTTLLNQVDTLLAEGTNPNDIGYFAFTRKAAHEARDRAVARFQLDAEEDFTYFRTLHSLAFLLLGMNTSEVLNDAHLKKFSEEVGVDLTADGVERNDDEGFIIIRSNHPVMRCIDIARSSLQGPEYAYRDSELLIPLYEFEHVYDEYQRFKAANGLKDFTDMLVDLAANPAYIPHLKAVLLDEAQDLTPLQWKIAYHLDEKSERMYIAGDDDQGIYRWAGADINKFISIPGGSSVLEQSYRVPNSVHRIATSITNRIRYRQQKNWFPRQEEGSTTRIYDPFDVDLHNGEWLVLAQANYMLHPMAEHLKSSGQFFERFNKPSLGAKVRSAINSWNHLTSDDTNHILLNEVQNLYAFISSGETGVERGAKKLLEGTQPQDLFSLESLRQHFGLRAEGSWETALDKIRDEDRAYATALLNRGIDINKKPKIRLSTIHGAKGGEADNVLLYLDLSGKALQQMERNPDDAHRVLYVGVTRTKENLVLKMPEDSQRGWAI